MVDTTMALRNMGLLWDGMTQCEIPLVTGVNMVDAFGGLYTELTGNEFDHNAPVFRNT